MGGLRQQNPLAQPTRARLFALLEGLRRPGSTAELAMELGLHVNGVRRHLESMEAWGLIERRKVCRGRGRPRDEWTVAAGAEPGGMPPRRYADLAVWLARAIPAGPARLREVEKTGREIGRELAPSSSGKPIQAFRDALAALGFKPDLETRPDGDLRCRLCNCPYVESVRENADVVCTLHRGITAGLLDRLAPDATLARWEPHDPETAGCIADLSGTGWPAAELRSGSPGG